MSWANPQSFTERAAAALLAPAAMIYGTAGTMRAAAYERGFMRQQQFPAMVVSVGNISCGGTGKTPVTIDFARELIGRGRHVAVLSRGYKRRSRESVVIVSDGHGPIVSVSDGGDEPFLIAQSVQSAKVLVGSRRVETARIALDQLGCDTLLLDDGFQHLKMARNLDVVLLDYNDDLWNNRVLPAGRLREPLVALRRADWVVITKLPDSPDFERLLTLRKMVASYAPQAQISCCRMMPKRLVPLGSSDVRLSAETLRGSRAFAFSAIARPDSFIEQLQELDVEVAGQLHFPDHHWFSAGDLSQLIEESRKCNAEILLTTSKDAVKLAALATAELARGLPIAVLEQEIEWMGPHPLSQIAGTPTGRLAAVGSR